MSIFTDKDRNLYLSPCSLILDSIRIKPSEVIPFLIEKARDKSLSQNAFELLGKVFCVCLQSIGLISKVNEQTIKQSLLDLILNKDTKFCELIWPMFDEFNYDKIINLFYTFYPKLNSLEKKQAYFLASLAQLIKKAQDSQQFNNIIKLTKHYVAELQNLEIDIYRYNAIPLDKWLNYIFLTVPSPDDPISNYVIDRLKKCHVIDKQDNNIEIREALYPFDRTYLFNADYKQKIFKVIHPHKRSAISESSSHLLWSSAPAQVLRPPNEDQDKDAQTAKRLYVNPSK